MSAEDQQELAVFRTEAMQLLSLQKALPANRVSVLEREIGLLLNPASTTISLDQYWAQLSAGNEEQAKAILRTCAEQGAPVPAFE